MVLFVAVGFVGCCISLCDVVSKGRRGQEMCGCCTNGEMLEDLGAYL